MMGFLCNVNVENITFDGNSVETDHDLVIFTGGTNSRNGRVNNCKFMRHTKLGLQSFSTASMVVTNNRFENVATGGTDQCALECLSWGQVSGNSFDRTTGYGDGSSLTFGGAKNTEVSHNTFNRVQDQVIQGISLEPFGNNYENMNIHDNIIVNGRITVGGDGSWSETTNRISICNNTLIGDTIRIKGPESGSHSTQMKNIVITGNQIYDTREIGLNVEYVAGPVLVKDNFIHNTNTSLNDVYTADKGGILIYNTTDAIVERNNILMDNNADVDFCPYGITYEDTTNLYLRDNRIINRTTSNPSYIAAGSNTGTKLISRNT